MYFDKRMGYSPFTITRRLFFMTKAINKYTKVLSHVAGISFEAADIDTFSLKVVSEFTEKEFTETTYENTSNHAPRKGTVEKVLKRWEKVDIYSLRQIDVRELMMLRLSKVPGIVYKKGNLFFYSAISGEFNLAGKSDDIGKHACSQQCTMVCKGCPRTSALTVAYQQRIGESFKASVVNSWRIEKYDFVLEGLETFNMFGQNDAFIVLRCENYQVSTTQTRLSHKNLNTLKVGLANYMWEDFNGNYIDMIKRLNVKR